MVLRRDGRALRAREGAFGLTTLHLVRHAHNPALAEGRLAGRADGVFLSDLGRTQAKALAALMSGVKLDAILSSPLARCRETAEIVAAGRYVELRDELLELDFGAWTGRLVADLDRDERWRRFNAFRAGTPCPGGESLLDAQARMVRLAVECRERFPGGELLLVGHGDPLRALLLHFLQMPLGAVFALELPPAGWATLELDDWGARLTRFAPLEVP